MSIIRGDLMALDIEERIVLVYVHETVPDHRARVKVATTLLKKVSSYKLQKEFAFIDEKKHETQAQHPVPINKQSREEFSTQPDIHTAMRFALIAQKDIVDVLMESYPINAQKKTASLQKSSPQPNTLLPLKKSSITKLMKSIGKELRQLSPEIWDTITAQYTTMYGDRELPSLDVLFERSVHTAVYKKHTRHSKGTLADTVVKYWKTYEMFPPGMPETTGLKFLHKKGILDKELIKKQYGTLDAIAHADFGSKNYSSKEKQQVRDRILAAALQQKFSIVQYLGLESSNMCSYIQFASALPIDPTQSLIAERDTYKSNIIDSLITHHAVIDGGFIFKGLGLFPGDVHDAVGQPRRKKNNKNYNLINLDYEGGWSKDKEETIERLFANHVSKNAILSITLNNSPIERTRVKNIRGKHKHRYNTFDQHTLLEQHMNTVAAAHGFSCTRLFAETYYSNTKEMITYGYALHKNTV